MRPNRTLRRLGGMVLSPEVLSWAAGRPAAAAEPAPSGAGRRAARRDTGRPPPPDIPPGVASVTRRPTSAGRVPAIAAGAGTDREPGAWAAGSWRRGRGAARRPARRRRDAQGGGVGSRPRADHPCTVSARLDGGPL